jgi:large subunit ribosomal protein L19
MPPQRATRDMNIIQQLESELGKPADALPKINVGDDVEVDYLIREGDKERIQTFKGLVLAIQGRGIRKTMVVRRIVQGEGVERTFPLHSPRVHDIRVTKRGRVRRSKLFYMRDRVGKSTRTKERLGEKVRAEREAEKARRTAQASKAQDSSNEDGE